VSAKELRADDQVWRKLEEFEDDFGFGVEMSNYGRNESGIDYTADARWD